MPNGTNVSLPIPEGMDEAQVKKLFETFITGRTTGQARDKSVRSATKELIKRHKPEYDKLYADAMKAG